MLPGIYIQLQLPSQPTISNMSTESNLFFQSTIRQSSSNIKSDHTNLKYHFINKIWHKLYELILTQCDHFFKESMNFNVHI
jgi:hypothetical protein